MRIVKESPIDKYLNDKQALYRDNKCVICREDGEIIAVFSEPFGIASKRQRAFIRFILNRIARRELDSKIVIREVSKQPFVLKAKRHETKESKDNK